METKPRILYLLKILLQYTDEVTLGRSIVNRIIFTGQM